MGAENGGYDQGGCVRGGLTSSPAYNVKLVTNTSSSYCANNGRRTPRCARRSPPSVAALFFTVRDSYTVDNTVDLYAGKPVFVQNRVICLPHLHSTSASGGFPSEYRHPVWYGKTRLVGLSECVKSLKICLFVLTWSTNVTDRQTQRHTDTAWRHRPRWCIASRGKNLTPLNTAVVNCTQHYVPTNTPRQLKGLRHVLAILYTTRRVARTHVTMVFSVFPKFGILRPVLDFCSHKQSRNSWYPSEFGVIIARTSSTRSFGQYIKLKHLVNCKRKWKPGKVINFEFCSILVHIVPKLPACGECIVLNGVWVSQNERPS